MQFNRIYYDAYDRKIYLWETKDGKRIYNKFPVEFEYYVEDKTGQSEITDIYGNPVIKKTSNSRKTIEELKLSGVKCFESDINQEVKFLQKYYFGKPLAPKMSDYQIGIIDIEIESDGSFPTASEAKYPINLISIKLTKQNRVFTFGLRPYEGKKDYFHFENEKELILSFFELFNKANVDIITGWNVVDFDIKYILNRCENLNIPLDKYSLSPIKKQYKNQMSGEWSIAGISVVDYLLLYKKFTYVTRESYKLDYIGMIEVGEGKLEYSGAIHDLYKTDWKLYVDYNIQDVILIEKLDNKLKLINFIINLAHESLIPFEKCFSSIAFIEGYILKYLHNKNMVMDDREFNEKKEFPGAYVEAYPGYYENNISFDFESLYPNILIGLNISPETLVKYPESEEGLIKSPISGIYYRKDKIGIIPEIVENIFNERKRFKNLMKDAKKEGNLELQSYYDSQQMIRKIQINSFYGCLSNPFFHYYNLDNAMAVTLTGQDLIKYVSKSFNVYFKEHFWLNKKFFKEENENNKIKNDVVVLLDTDSTYLCFDEVKKKIDPDAHLLQWAKDFDNNLLNPFIKSILKKYCQKYGIDRNFNFKREKISPQMMVLAKKAYVTVVIHNEGIDYEKPELSITGIASKKTSTPSFCRNKINFLIEEMFRTKDVNHVTNLIRGIKDDFIKSSLDIISFPRGISDYGKYAFSMREYELNGLKFRSATPIQNRASIIYNYLIHIKKLPYEPIDSGSKIKYIYVHENNPYQTNVIGFIGNYPKEFEKIFKVDYSLQFEKSLLEPMQRIFDVMGWGTIILDQSNLDSFFE